MGRDRMRVLVCAIASIVLTVVGALGMDWYRLTIDPTFEAALDSAARIGIDLRGVHICNVGQVCVTASLSPMPGMFPTLAVVTLWSSLGVCALVAFQATIRILSGSANDAITKLGYMVSLMAISIAFSAAYMFGPETDGPMLGTAAEMGIELHRTWAPLVLIGGLVAGFATFYMAVAPESSDPAAEYKPLHLAPARVVGDAPVRPSSMRIPFPERTGQFPLFERSTTPRPAADRAAASSSPIAIPLEDRPTTVPPELQDFVRDRPTTDLRRPATVPPPLSTEPRGVGTPTAIPAMDTIPALHDPSDAPPQRPAGSQPIRTEIEHREHTSLGMQPIERLPAQLPSRRDRPGTGVPITRERIPSSAPAARERTPSGVPATRERTPTGLHPHARSGPIPPMPDHLRNRLSYVVVTAEVTAGGIDARREDGSSRLVLWRDVVGVVARRTPPAYDGMTFIDVVSTAGSTLRFVPWTRLTGDTIEAEGDARPRALVELVQARCPGTKLDPATRQFLDAGDAAQLPDLETLRAHDQRLA